MTRPSMANTRRLVLASSSRYRARVLAEAGIVVDIEAPDVDERALDDDLGSSTVEQHAVALAELKAAAVGHRLAGSDRTVFVIGADQLGVVGHGSDLTILHKRSTVDGAVDQLMSMSGTTHRLVNGLVVLDPETGAVERGVDVMEVTMRRFTAPEALAYVERFLPFDSAGSYRIEDQDQMSPADRFITAVTGEDPSGVLGMPVPLLVRMLRSIGAHPTAE